MYLTDEGVVYVHEQNSRGLWTKEQNELSSTSSGHCENEVRVGIDGDFAIVCGHNGYETFS